MKKILILGIGGFTGKHFCEFISEKCLYCDFEFVGVDRVDAISCEHVKFIKSDVIERANLRNILNEEKPNYIINFVGIYHSDDYNELISYNVDISRNIFDIIKGDKLKCDNVLLIGSAAEYGNAKRLPISEGDPLNPVNLYGLSKAIQTQIAKYYNCNYGIPCNIARTFNLIGEHISEHLSIGSFAKQIKNANDGDVIYVGDLLAKRDYLCVEKAVEAYWKILINGGSGDIYNVCSGRSVMVGEILESMVQKSGKKLGIIQDDGRIKQNDISDSYGDNSKLVKLGVCL